MEKIVELVYNKERTEDKYSLQVIITDAFALLYHTLYCINKPIPWIQENFKDYRVDFKNPKYEKQYDYTTKTVEINPSNKTLIESMPYFINERINGVYAVKYDESIVDKFIISVDDYYIEILKR